MAKKKTIKGKAKPKKKTSAKKKTLQKKTSEVSHQVANKNLHHSEFPLHLRLNFEASKKKINPHIKTKTK